MEVLLSVWVGEALAFWEYALAAEVCPDGPGDSRGRQGRPQYRDVISRLIQGLRSERARAGGRPPIKHDARRRRRSRRGAAGKLLSSPVCTQATGVDR